MVTPRPPSPPLAQEAVMSTVGVAMAAAMVAVRGANPVWLVEAVGVTVEKRSRRLLCMPAMTKAVHRLQTRTGALRAPKETLERSPG